MRKSLLALPAVLMVMAAAAWAAGTPAVLTGSPTKISNHGALVHAVINPGGDFTTFRFQYGLTKAYGSETHVGAAGRGTKPVVVHAGIGALNPGTAYHYRVVATNKLGSSFGRDRIFETTGHPLPGAITGLPSAVGTSSATLTGTVITQHETTSFVFEYGTTTGYGMQTGTASATAAFTPSSVVEGLTNLLPLTTYHYRLVANHAGTPPEYGLDQTFTTLPLSPLQVQVKAHTTPVHVRHKPYLFTTIGRIVPPSSVPAGVGCTGFVKIRFLHGRHTVATSTVPMQANCTFSTQVRFRHLVNRRRARLRIVTRFEGNSYLASARTKGQKVRLG